MEFVSSSQLQKYEEIIDQIKHENERYETLKNDLEKENDNIILSQLARTTPTRKLSHLNIQVFRRFIDLINLYGDELDHNFSNLLDFDCYKFYLIEIYVTKSFMIKARRLKCKLNITVATEYGRISKTVVLSNKTPIREIIPVNKSFINSSVEINLIIPSQDKCMVLKLDTVFIDISYHFEMYKENQKGQHAKLCNILQIARSYNKATILQSLEKPMKLEKKLYFDVSKDFFISTILKNCYHMLDLELFLELKDDTERDFILKLSNGVDTFNAIFNINEKYLKIIADISNMALLKKYFYKQLYNNTEIDLSSSANIRKIMVHDHVLQDSEELCNLLCEVRQSWAKLPI